ncbi:uncharacterized protein LOC114942716 [Nylanderia fulva]|uniref:uncharacterized protein LOC114942716 n=1 Tax=Nylanderia fulva TaxID=613905 RepID=UPI0010FB0B2E|nr:uncharacterized protein LOC114942716 [Nylanderia fulva]
MIVYTLSAFSAIILIGLCIAEELPVTTCKRNSSNYFNCLKLAVEESWPQFIKGLPEFDFPPLDPLSYKHGTFDFDRGEVHGKITIKNAIAYGLKNAKFAAVRAHFLDDIFRLEIDTQVPKLFLEGDCEAEGRIGGFKMGGKGSYNLTIDDIRGTWDLIGHVANDTWTVEHFYCRPTVKNMKIYLNNLFDGNKEFNDLAMYFANEYWPILYRSMLPVTSEIWDPWLSGFANRLFSKVSFSKLFP